ncbi:phospholipase [Pseudomonas sp. PB120]|uniref:phosphatidylinositol-specific phospholipase C domain-containing protein n=1 Tax=Pseudomonas sp. PB120 TaxID=2494700 RepID=UPI0012FE206F|nr:phosphatidylinositol-specific phospholipase C domain-containing protein [Pseudomonas sp. PB120]MVV50397.1 phospholipase [Pseudomonas sp. PB120]
MTNSADSSFDKQKWMSNVLDIDRLKLTDIVWPGAHNAGMDKQAPNYDVVIGNWTTCQNDSFAWQLAQGARALDIRLGYTEGHDQSIFYFHHNGYQSHRVLDELIDAISTFLDQNRDEFIILDFHQLGDRQKPFAYDKLNDVLISRLGPRLIPYSDSMKTVGELKRISTRRRLILTAPGLHGLDDDYFWPRISHKWSGEVFTDTDELERHISSTLRNAPTETFLWSLSATSYGFLGGPQDIKKQINDWFNPTRDWVTRCSIVSTDFFDESDIVRYCWSASSMKAVYGSALHRSVDA